LCAAAAGFRPHWTRRSRHPMWTSDGVRPRPWRRWAPRTGSCPHSTIRTGPCARSRRSRSVRVATRVRPALLTMVVEGDRDVEAADVLGALARRQLPAERICTELVALLDTPGVPQEQAREQGQEAVRVRIVHALAELPGEAPDTALRRLARDPARRVAVTATAVLRVRGAGGP